MIINNDKIEIQFTTEYEYDFNEYQNTSNIRIVRNTDNYLCVNTVFNQLHNIHYNNICIGQIWSKPRTKKNMFQIKFFKQIIYDWQDLLLRFYDEFTYLNPEFTYDGFVNLETCLNTLDPTTWNHIFRIQANLKDSEQCLQPLYESNSKSNIVIHNLYNNKEFVIFNRSNSIESSKPSNKVVIYKKTNLTEFQIKFYNLNDLDVIDHLYRLEVRLNRKFFTNLLRSNKTIEFKFIFDQANLIQLFDSAIGDKLSFKDLANPYYDKHRNKKFKIIDLHKPYSTLKDLKLTEYPKTESKPINASKRVNNQTFRNLSLEYLKTPTNRILGTLKDLVIINQIDYNTEFKKIINKGFNPDSFNLLIKELGTLKQNYHYN